MSRAHDSVPAVPESPAVAERLLDGGEVVLLAIRPSLWSVILSAGPVLLATALVAGAALLAEQLRLSVPAQTIATICLAVAAIRLGLAGGQWMARLYVLTNHRVLWITGLVRVEVSQVYLMHVAETEITDSRSQRAVGVGDLHFLLRNDRQPPDAWSMIASPQKVKQQVDRAVKGAGP